jgi:hypothetical protein
VKFADESAPEPEVMNVLEPSLAYPQPSTARTPLARRPVMREITYREALNEAMREEMERDPASSSWAKRSATTRAPTR